MHRTRGTRLRSLADPLRLALLLAAWLLGLLAMAPVQAQDGVDPPARVGRIALLEGPVWIFDAEQQRWTDAQVNLPLTAGDRVRTEARGRAVLRIGSTTVTLDEASAVAFDRLDDDQIRIRVMQGEVALGVRAGELASGIRIGTDDAWLLPRREGLYRVQHGDGVTAATSWRGELQVLDDSRVIVESGRRVQLWRDGGALQWRMLASVDDDFAARVLAAEREEQAPALARHVSPEMTGAEDLDRYGRWDQHPEYGAVWYPSAVAVDWAPYRNGRWVFVQPWGWTWVDAAPWGFAPFHYGRWMQWRARWVWVPGRYVARPVYAPALVAWIDAPLAGIGIRIGVGTFSWMPLAPWEVFRPAYRASPGYLARVDHPDWRRHRPPPDWRGPGDYRHGPLPHGVSVVPADTLRRVLPVRPVPPRSAQPERAPEPWNERTTAPLRDPRREPPRSAAPVIVHPPTMGSSPGAPLRTPPQAGQPQGERVERGARQRLPERNERPDRVERGERGERVERVERVERPERAEQPEQRNAPDRRGPDRRESMR